MRAIGVWRAVVRLSVVTRITPVQLPHRILPEPRRSSTSHSDSLPPPFQRHGKAGGLGNISRSGFGPVLENSLRLLVLCVFVSIE